MKKANWELGWKIPNGFLIKWFLSGWLLRWLYPHPHLNAYLRVSADLGYRRQSAVTQSVENLPQTLYNYQPRWISYMLDRTILAEEGWETSSFPWLLMSYLSFSSIWLQPCILFKRFFKKTWPQGKIEWFSLPAACRLYFNDGTCKDVLFSDEICQN